MSRILVLGCLLWCLVPQYAPAQNVAAKGKVLYEAQFSTWPTVRNEHGYVGAESGLYVMEATSNTWMGPGAFLPITPLTGDFVIDMSFKVIYRENCSLNITLSDAGRDYSQLDFFFDIWQSGAPTFSIYENSVQNDFYVNIKRRFAERTQIKQNLSLVDWKKVNTLSVKRERNNVFFYLNGNLLQSFLSPAFPVKKLGFGISFKSKILLTSVKARTTR